MKRWRFALVTALSMGWSLALFSACAFGAGGVVLQIKDAPLREVVMLLTQQSGTNIVLADESRLDKKITASLNDVPLEKALDYIVKSAGVSYRKMEDGTYIISSSLGDDTVVPAKDIIPNLPAIEPQPVFKPRESKIEVVKLIHSKPSELLRLIGWEGANPMPNTDVQYPDRTGAGKPKTTNPGGGVYLNNNNEKTVYDIGKPIRMENGTPTIPTIDPASLNPSGAGRTADVSSGAAQYHVAAPPGYSPANVQRPSTTTGTSQSASSSPSGGSGNFLWPEGVDDARPFDLDNSIIVKGDVDGIEKFKKIVRMLDVPPKQVQIEAKFVEVKTTDIKNFGIDWSLERLNESFNTAFGPAGNVVVGFATGNLTAQLKTQLSTDIGRVINAPIISTINNQNAYISINTVIPYWVTIATVVGDNNVINNSTPQFITIDTHLDVLPRVNGDGTITMILRPGVADTGNVITGPDGSQIPEQRNQELFTQRRVANGETIVVGGFIRKNESNSIQKIPILADLPIVGSLFRTTAKTSEDRELLIFVTPRIIPQTGGGSVGEGLVP